MHPSVLENQLVEFNVGLQNSERHFRGVPNAGQTKSHARAATVGARRHSAHRPVYRRRAIAAVHDMGLPPSNVRTCSMTAATWPRFVITIRLGVLSSPSRAATSEKQSSSSVKCSESFMGFVSLPACPRAGRQQYNRKSFFHRILRGEPEMFPALISAKPAPQGASLHPAGSRSNGTRATRDCPSIAPPAFAIMLVCSSPRHLFAELHGKGTMPTEVVMPQMGESIFEGTITKWLKKPGDKVQRDEPLFEISTDKVDAEIPAPASGILQEIKVSEGNTVQVNTVVGVIGEGNGAAAPAPAKAAAPAPAPAKKEAPAPPPAAAAPAASVPASVRKMTTIPTSALLRSSASWPASITLISHE